jgi:hypothetical protein
MIQSMFVFLSESCTAFQRRSPLGSDRATMRVRLRSSHHEIEGFLTTTTGDVLVPFSS